MATVLAESDLKAAAPTPAPRTSAGEIVPFPQDEASEGRALIRNAQEGVKRLMAMSPDELRALIADRVTLLETELKEREARRAALEEARAAQRVLEARRRRALRIRRRVNVASTVMVASLACFIMASVL